MCRIIRRIATAALDFPASVPYTGPVASPPFVGIDLVEPSRLAERLERNPSLGMTLFTNRERGYCIAQHHPEQHLAARYCAKEAVIKALGIDGWDPLEVEIIGGGPEVSVQLHGDVAAVAAMLGVVVTVSMTHLESLAAAIALARPAAP